MKNYYEILEVSENASAEIIDRAYRVLAKKYHPDTWSNNTTYAENKFKELTEAYKVLSDPVLRNAYNMQLNDTLRTQEYNNLHFKEQKKHKTFNNVRQKKNNQYNDSETFSQSIASGMKSLFSSIKSVIKNEKLKSAEERSKDFKALILTIIIISVLLFIFLKVPFLRKLLFS